ncbi:MAG TPA: STAS domain-containing protein [Conexibacter sp.]|nr:STAS domain-containing protein [Conexibacter sp.]
MAVEPQREYVRVTPYGELDLVTVEELGTEIDQLRSDGIAAIVLDLRQLSFMDSTGLRLLLSLDAAARSDGFDFSIVDGEGPVRRLLELTRLDGRFARADG